MKILNEVFEKMGTTMGLPHLTSNYCYNHIPKRIMPAEPTPEQLAALQGKFRVQMMLENGIEICPRCECDKMTKDLENEINENIAQEQARKLYGIFTKQSVFQDETLQSATFESYALEAHEHEARANKQKVMQTAEDYKRGQQINLWLTGNVGVGKSHLSVSILQELNSLETSCAFVDVDEMFRKIRHAMFENKESPFTEAYFIDLATKVDFLVLDDIGAETGNIHTEKEASDFTSRVLRAIVNGRQNKSTIFTTNLTSTKIRNMYDDKLVDRMFKHARIINFKETISFRSRGIDF